MSNPVLQDMLVQSQSRFNQAATQYTRMRKQAITEFLDRKRQGLTGDEEFEDWVQSNSPQLMQTRAQLEQASAMVMQVGGIVYGPQAATELLDYRLFPPTNKVEPQDDSKPAPTMQQRGVQL